MCERQISEDEIINYQNFSIPISDVIRRYKNNIKQNDEVEILPFIYLKKENKLFNKKYIIKCKNSIDDCYLKSESVVSDDLEIFDKKIEYINEKQELGWVSVDDISYQTNLNCDVIDLFRTAGWIINGDTDKYAPFTEFQVWEMTKNNTIIFNSICMNCSPCKSKVNYNNGIYDLNEKYFYAKNVFCKINILNQQDEILVNNTNGGLVMAEGKHRICLCKKMNYDKMLVKIIDKGRRIVGQKNNESNLYRPQEVFYKKAIKWDLLCKEFYNFYLNKLKISRDDLNELYCNTTREEFIEKIENILNKSIIEIIKLKEIRERQKEFDLEYFANN